MIAIECDDGAGLTTGGKLHHLRTDLPSDQRLEVFELMSVRGVEVNANPCPWFFFHAKKFCFADTILLM